ncbi:MAG: LamG-like jellyroll fold domain-containing protein [Chitinophagales bacterium]
MVHFLPAIQIPDLRKRTKQYILPFFIYFILLHLLSPVRVSAQGIPAGNDKVKQYNEAASRLISQCKYDESIPLLKQVLQEKENSESYYLLGHIHMIRNEWDEVINDQEKAIQLDPNNMPVYPDLFYAYTKVGRWKDAQAISEKAKQGDTNHSMSGTISSIDTQVENANRSNIAVVVFFLILAGIFFLPYYRLSKDPARDIFNNSNLRFTEVLLVSASVSCILYTIFFTFSRWIWSQNPHIPTTDYAAAMRIAVFEHDGVESFVMYALVFVNMLLTLLATAWVLKLKKNKSLYLPVFIILLLISGYYFFRVGFFPPFPSVDTQYIFLPVVLGLLSIGLFILYRYNSMLSKLAVVALAAFAGLVPLAPPSLVDLAFILDPALRLIHGFKVSEIYFQYDLFLSFLAYAWMKLNFAIEWFPYLGTLSFFLFFISIFFFSDRFFQTKGLSVIFIIALILARLYMISFDNQMIIQVTPLRLDLWIILLLVAHYKGVHHWLLGTCIGLLVLFHRNLGLIYLGSYVELLVVLFLADIVALVQEKKLNVKALSVLFVKHLRLNAKNLVIIVASIALCFILFKEMFSASALVYRKLGIGMLPVSRMSFYWYVPVILGCLVVFLLYYRNKLGAKYTTTGLFIILLAVGNSMYFFGRSHENNILNITGILILTIFVLFDVLIFLAPQPQQVPPQKEKAKNALNKNTPVKRSYLSERSIYLFLPVLFVVFIGYYFSERIFDKAKTQYNNLLESDFSFPFQQLGTIDTAAIRQITHNSPDVYFLDERYDFYYYYYGKYAPIGYYSPFGAWIYKKDIINFIQGQLDKNYYIVFNSRNILNYSEYLPYLRYNQSYQKNEMIALKKEDVPFLLPEDTNSLLHIGIKDSLANPGLDYGGLDIKGDFTVEVVVKPVNSQAGHEVVINNLSQFANEGLRGFTFQQNNAPNQYIFGFSNGTTAVPNVVFNLDNNIWHYVVATVNKESLKIYDNGKLLSSANSGGALLVNSELPLVIGNRISRDCHFRGYIREVKISNGNKDQNEIISTAQKLDAALNNSNGISPAK